MMTGFIPNPKRRRLTVDLSTNKQPSLSSCGGGGFAPKSKRIRGQFSKQQRERGQFSTKQQQQSSHSHYSSRYDTLPYLPDELVYQILLKLPIKSIVRFSSVSKSWSALFKTDSFIENHQNKGTMLLINRPFPPFPPPNTIPSQCHGFSFHDLDSPEKELRSYIPTRFYENENLLGKDFDTKLQPKLEATVKGIHGSVNGIICLCYHPLCNGLYKTECSQGRFHPHHNRSYILCNPALGQFKLLPPCASAKPPPRHSLIATIDGFGVSKTNTHGFKVITMQTFISKFGDIISHLAIGHVYDLKTDSWREVKKVPMWPLQPFNSSGDVIFFNGACHWPAKTFLAEGRRKGILSFDMTSELFRHLELPDCLQGLDIADPQPVVVDNCLAVVQCKKLESESDPFEIWVMKEYGVKKSWTKNFVISPQPYATVFLPWKGDMFIVQEPGNDKENQEGIAQKSISLRDARLNGQLTSVNLCTNKVNRFQLFGVMGTMRALIYEESLVSLY